MTLSDGQSRAEVRAASTGKIQDPEFVRFLEEIGRERLAAFATEDFLVLDLVHREQPVPGFLKPRLEPLLEQGLIDRIGRGRGVRYLLSRRFYRFLGKPGVYTLRRGLDRDTNKALLLKHIEGAYPEGCAMAKLQRVCPALGRRAIQVLFDDLRAEGRVRVEGETRGARWFAIPKGQTREMR